MHFSALALGLAFFSSQYTGVYTGAIPADVAKSLSSLQGREIAVENLKRGVAASILERAAAAPGPGGTTPRPGSNPTRPGANTQRLGDKVKYGKFSSPAKLEDVIELEDADSPADTTKEDFCKAAKRSVQRRGNSDLAVNKRDNTDGWTQDEWKNIWMDVNRNLPAPVKIIIIGSFTPHMMNANGPNARLDKVGFMFPPDSPAGQIGALQYATDIVVRNNPLLKGVSSFPATAIDPRMMDVNMARTISQYSTDFTFPETNFPGTKLMMVNAWYDFQLILKMESMYKTIHEDQAKVRSRDIREGAAFLGRGAGFNRGLPQEMTTLNNVFAIHGKADKAAEIIADTAGYIHTASLRLGGIGFGQTVVFFLNSVEKSKRPC